MPDFHLPSKINQRTWKMNSSLSDCRPLLTSTPLAGVALTVPTVGFCDSWKAMGKPFYSLLSHAAPTHPSMQPSQRRISQHFHHSNTHSLRHLVVIYYQRSLQQIVPSSPPFFISSSSVSALPFWSVLWHFICVLFVSRDSFHLPVCLASYHFKSGPKCFPWHLPAHNSSKSETKIEYLKERQINTSVNNLLEMAVATSVYN